MIRHLGVDARRRSIAFFFAWHAAHGNPRHDDACILTWNRALNPIETVVEIALRELCAVARELRLIVGVAFAIDGLAFFALRIAIPLAIIAVDADVFELIRYRALTCRRQDLGRLIFDGRRTRSLELVEF